MLTTNTKKTKQKTAYIYKALRRWKWPKGKKAFVLTTTTKKQNKKLLTLTRLWGVESDQRKQKRLVVCLQMKFSWYSPRVLITGCVRAKLIISLFKYIKQANHIITLPAWFTVSVPGTKETSTLTKEIIKRTLYYVNRPVVSFHDKVKYVAPQSPYK